MWSRRDQLQAYQFLRRRLVSAVVVGDANHPESPARRIAVAGLAGVAAVLLGSAALLVLGVLRPGSANSWKSGGQVIVEKETGTRYVLDKDGALHPALNYASARLFLGSSAGGTVQVSRNSLAGSRRGLPVGIPGAPDAVPPADQLMAGPWTVCSTAGRTSVGPTPVSVSIALGAVPGGVPLADGQAVVVTVPAARQRFLVTGGHRYLLPSDAVALALGYGDSSTDLLVGAAWVTAIPAGPDLDFIAIVGAGASLAGIPGQHAELGDVFVVQQLSGSFQYYVGVGGGLDPITQTEAQLILANPLARHPGAPPKHLTPADVSSVKVGRDLSTDRGYPRRLPRLVTPQSGRGTVLCTTLTTQGPIATATLDLRAQAPGGIAVDKGPQDRPDSYPVADAVLVPPGRGAVVRETVGDGFSSSAVYLVTDQGIRYPLPNGDAVAALGYAKAAQTPVPKAVLDLLPIGPRLDPKAVLAAR